MSGGEMFGRKLSAQEAEMYLGGETMALISQQLMFVLLDRLGGEITIPVSEVDATGKFMMFLDVDHRSRTFTLKLGKKS